MSLFFTLIVHESCSDQRLQVVFTACRKVKASSGCERRLRKGLLMSVCTQCRYTCALLGKKKRMKQVLLLQGFYYLRTFLKIKNIEIS